MVDSIDFLKVLSHTPNNHSDNILLKSTIEIKFSSDVDSDTLDEKSVQLLDPRDKNIDIEIYPKGKIVEIKPKEKLSPDTQYKVILKGTIKNPKLHSAIMDILEKPLPRNYEFSFKTVKIEPLKIPQITKPTHQTIVRDLEIRWNKIDGAKNYNIEICSDKLFNNILYSTTTTKTKIEPYGIRTNQEYFVRVNASNEIESGEWSKTVSFYYKSKEYQDSIPTEKDEFGFEHQTKIEILDLEDYEIDLETSYFLIRINEKIKEEDLKYLDISLKGYGLKRMPHINSHGLVDAQFYIKETNDAYSIIKCVI